MARRKKDPEKAALAQAIMEKYKPESVEDMQNALKDIFGPLFEGMLQGELDYGGAKSPGVRLIEDHLSGNQKSTNPEAKVHLSQYTIESYVKSNVRLFLYGITERKIIICQIIKR